MRNEASTTETQKTHEPMFLTPAEEKLILRLRQLTRGTYFVTIDVDGEGPTALTFLSHRCKVEQLK